MSNIKIAVLGTRGFPNVQGGVEAHCENLYPLLAQKGAEITVFTRKPYVGTGLPEFYRQVKLVPLACPKNKFLEAPVHTFLGIFAARKIRPDILHLQAIGPSLFAPLAKLLGFKVVMTHHGPDYRRKKWGVLAKAVLKFSEFSGTCCADAVIAVSEGIANEVKSRCERNVLAIENGVRPAEPSLFQGALKKFSLQKGKYILAVGRLVPEKGFVDLITAFRKFKQADARKSEGWKLVIAGKADHEDAYSRKIRELCRADQDIVLTGYLSGVPLAELYSHAGLFVLPSYYEGLPIALLEALGYGLSCILSDIPAHKGLGLAKERYFCAGEITELSDKLSRFILEGFSENQRNEQVSMVRRRYDWESAAAKTLEVYQTVLKR